MRVVVRRLRLLLLLLLRWWRRRLRSSLPLLLLLLRRRRRRHARRARGHNWLTVPLYHHIPLTLRRASHWLDVVVRLYGLPLPLFSRRGYAIPSSLPQQHRQVH